MDNQYNYYRSDENQEEENYSYSYQYQDPEASPKKKKKIPKKFLSVVLLAIMFGVVGSLAFNGTNYLIEKAVGPGEIESTKPVTNTQISTSNSSVTSDVSSIVENTMPSVVSITNLSVQQVQNFFGGIREYESESAGSGFIVGQTDSELLIVSNNHVVEGSKTLTVTFCDESSVNAKIKGTDAARDLAVIAVPLDEIEENTLKTIKVATLGDSDHLKVGEPAIAIGNALGYGQSVTTGIVSAIGRQVENFEGEYIQTDAAINPGNSGGALLNINGEVIGINSAKIASSSVEGMGFAIPISDVQEILQNLMNRETREIVPEWQRGYIGIKGYDVTEESAMMYDMPVGVYIAEVINGTGAEKAKLAKGMIVTKFEGITIESMEELSMQLSYYKIGEEIELVVQVPVNGGAYEEEIVIITLGKAVE